MKIDQCVKEMEGKISLLDSKKFIYGASLLGVYSIAYLGFLAFVIWN